MEEIGKNMITRCLGLPFPIVALAKLTRPNVSLRGWAMQHEIINLSTICDIDAGDGSVSEFLDFSYDDLSSSTLQTCFLYVCNLPWGHEVDSEKLCQLSIAEDIISSDNLTRKDGTIMNVAKSYLNELEQKSMVQVQAHESIGRTRFVHSHEFLRERSLSKPYVHKFHVLNLRLDGVEENRRISSSSNSSLNLETKKIAICLGDQEDLDNYVPPKRKIAQQLHSELLFLQKYNHRSRISRRVESHLSDLKLVRVLDLGGLVFSKLDRAIGKLIYLKYLGLRYTVFHELPSAIANIEELQTLDLWDDNTQYATIPNVLWKLK